MERTILLNPIMNEIVFDGRNKAYGAYALRHAYERNMAKGMISGILFFLLAISSPFITRYFKAGDILEKEIFITSPVIQLENFKKEIMVKPPVAAAISTPPPLKSQIKFIPPVVVPDDKTNHEELPPGIDELKEKVIGVTTIESVETGIDAGLIEDKPAMIEDTEMDAKVYESFAVQQQPEFPDGMAAMYKFLKDNLDFPQLAKELKLSGTVFVQFVVSKEGTIEDIKVIRGIGGGLDQEALRVMHLMPKWKPGKHNGKPVAVHMILPVKFKLL